MRRARYQSSKRMQEKAGVMAIEPWGGGCLGECLSQSKRNKERSVPWRSILMHQKRSSYYAKHIQLL